MSSWHLLHGSLGCDLGARLGRGFNRAVMLASQLFMAPDLATSLTFVCCKGGLIWICYRMFCSIVGAKGGDLGKLLVTYGAVVLSRSSITLIVPMSLLSGMLKLGGRELRSSGGKCPAIQDHGSMTIWSGDWECCQYCCLPGLSILCDPEPIHLPAALPFRICFAQIWISSEVGSSASQSAEGSLLTFSHTDSSTVSRPSCNF